MSPPRSLVAGANALFRAAESRRPAAERILDDPFAHWFAETDARVMALRYGRFALPPLWAMIDALQTVHCVRHRTLDELVLAAVERDGFRQVVVVGAGYDMRPWRFAGRPGCAGVHWFEADLPATGARKRRLLEARGEPRRRATQVAVDLQSGSLATALGATGFDFEAPAVFVLEGLIHYLSPERLDALLGDTARGGGRRRVLCSFIRPDMYARASGLFIRLVKLVREIPRLTFSPEALAALLAGHGYGNFESFGLAAQIARFAPQAAGRRVKVSQDVARADRP